MGLQDGHDWSRQLADRVSLREARLWDGRTWSIVRRKRLVFTHVPKSGGTSLDTYLASFFRADEILPPRLQILGPAHWTEADWNEYRYFHGGHPFDEVRSIGNSHFVTLFRDPVSRIRSLYRHLKRTEDLSDQIPEKQEARRVLRELAESCTFEEWVRQPTNLNGSYPRNVYVALLTGGYACTNRASPEELETLVDRALQALQSEFAFFGVLDQYARSKRLFCRTFGLPAHFALGEERLNVGPPDPRRDPIDSETLAIIEQENAADLDLYRRALQVFEQRCAEMEKLPPDEIEQPRRHRRRLRSAEPRGRLVCFASDLRGTGVHPEESRESQPPHRWMGGEAGIQITLAADLPRGAELTVLLAVSEVAAESAFRGLKLRLDGEEARGKSRHSGWRHDSDGLVYRARFRVTADMAERPIHTLEIDAPTEVPSEISVDSTDTRALSIAVQAIELRWQPPLTMQEKLRRWVNRRWDRWRKTSRRAA